VTDPTALLTTDRIMNVGRKLLELRPLQEVLDAVTSVAIETMHAENSLVILRSPGGDQLQIAATRHSGEGAAPTLETITQSLIENAMERRRPVLTESAQERSAFSPPILRYPSAHSRGGSHSPDRDRSRGRSSVSGQPQ
jgi:hypothetical protein